MLEVAAGAAEERHLSNIIFRHGYAEKLPFEDASFEVVINRYSAHHWYDVGQALREVNRVLKPGGALIMMDIMLPGHPVRDTSHVRNYSSGEWLAMANKALLVTNTIYCWSFTHG